MSLADTILEVGQIYLWIGLVVAAGFLLIGIDRIRPDAHNAFLFRLVIAPGVIGLWPIVIWRWAALERREG